MFKVFPFVISLVILTSASASQLESVNPIEDEALFALEQIEYIVRNNYSFIGYKKQLLGWDYRVELERIRNEVKASKITTPDSFRKALVGFAKATRDLHVSFEFFKRGSSQLPFRIRGAGTLPSRSYYISEVDSTLTKDLAVGDKLLSVDGTKVSHLVEDLFPSAGLTHPLGQVVRAEIKITTRSAFRGDEIPFGDVDVEVEKVNGSTTTVRVSWKHFKETQPDSPDLLSPVSNSVKSSVLGSKQGMLPNFGKVDFEFPPSAAFRGYVFELAGKKYGYIRIGSFSDRNLEKNVQLFGRLVAGMDKNTDALVLDTTDNNGGFKLYAHALARYLSAKPMQGLKVQTVLSDREITSAVTNLQQTNLVVDDATAKRFLGSNRKGYPTSFVYAQDIKSEAQFYLDQFSKGKLLSDPHYESGLNIISPAYDKSGHFSGYSKPILLLINSYSFSSGDEFAALLKDNQVVKTFGSRTGGAGGKVVRIPFPNRLGIVHLSLTASMTLRLDGSVLENNGVSADFPYEPTGEDFSNGFKGYERELGKALNAITTP